MVLDKCKSDAPVIEAHRAGVFLETRRSGEHAVEFGTPGSDPALTRVFFEQGEVEVGNDHVIIGLPGLNDRSSVGIEYHRVPGPDLIIIKTDSVAIDEK